ncbi:MAG: Ig-like domain-containing protein [Paludibacteraceae bacterium]|nr:Ig-like domain-containing protein [Paludibacteraceae bacterium]
MPLLVLLLLMVGNSAVWGASVDCSFTQGETIYFRLSTDVNWGDAGAYPAAVFYYSSNSAQDTKTNGTNWDNMNGSCNIGSSNYTRLTSLGDNRWSITIPRSDIGYIRIVRVSGGDANWTWNNQSKMCVTDAGTNNCIYCNGWDNTGTWETYAEGRTSTCGDPSPTPTNWSFRGDMWLNGSADDAGWLGGSSSNVPHFIDNGDGTATCSFIFPNAQCRLTLCDNGTDKTSDRCDGTTNITKSSFSSDKYHFAPTGDTKKYTFTLDLSTDHFTANAEAYPIQKTGWHIFMSAGDGDPTEVGTITEESGLVISNVSSGSHNLYITDGSATTIAGVNWFGGLYIDKTNSNVGWATQREYYGDGKFSSTGFPIRDTKDATGRFKLDATSDIVVAFDGGKITINKAVAPDPSLQPWSGDSNRDWYLTGDFSNPGVFDAWVQNPSGYKFAANGDNYQTVSITLDPNDASIFHDNNGHKLTRFEIIRQGTWDDPRINKPQFDATTSNCSLQTDWKDAGSNRMSLELTVKSVIKFDIWRWGTAPGSADRKVTVTITPVPQVTVTFIANGETFATQTFDKGGKATIPAGAPVREGYNFNGWDWDFNTTVNENTTVNATWTYKAIESVSLNESAHTTWIGNSDFVLTATYSPADLITKSVAWSSNNTSVATISNNGTVTAVGAGTTTITCTVTDMLENESSATCEVTVAACEMTTDNIYSMTVTGYDSSTGNEAILTNLWNESRENDGPATFRIVKLKLFNNYYVYDDNGTVKMSTDASLSTAQWYEIPTGENYSPNWTGSSFALYEFKNVNTGRYMRRGNGRYGNNGDWYYYTTLTDNRETDGNIYKFFYDNTMGTHLVCREGADYNEGNTITELRKAFAIHNNNLNWADGYSGHCAAPMVICGYTNDPQDNAYTKLHETVVVDPSYPNPAYLASQMNGSYYRMNTNATVKANLGNALVSGAVITVSLYADANTTVKLTKTDGTEVETINLSADTEREYTYTGSALVGESAFVIKANDNNAGIASIRVTRTYVATPSYPTLEWDTDLNGGVTQSALGSTFKHVASSAISSGAIRYSSSNEAVATVAADGTVTPHSAGNTTITATIEAEGCYSEAFIQYNITLTEASLQEAIDATPVGGTLTLAHDYNENAVINKAITLDAKGYTIGDLTVEYTGDLTLSSELTVRDFTIYAKAGNTSIPAASGQVRNADKLKVNGNAYFLYTVDPSDRVQYGWYDFTVPFPINIVSGIKGIQNGVLKEDFRNGVDYAVMEYFGEKQAQGQYPYKKFSGVMQPNKLYTIALDDSYNYNTLRMQKTADGALVASESVTLNPYTGGDAINANWNGVGNGTLHHADAGISGDYIQVYQSGSKTFLPVNKNDYSLVVGSAFMVQGTGTMTLSQATHGALLAPSRYESAPATAIQIASEGKPFSDQLFITASETGGQAYTPGVDVAKAGELGSANVPQIWTNAYNSSLCVHEAQLINGKAQYKLSIYAPVAGAYTLTSKNIPADYSLYLTQNGMIVSELSDTYTLDLSKGITTEYGLLLTEIYNSPTGIENTQTDKIQTTKIIRNGVLYILHNGKVYNAQGAMVK